jgi:LytR cell envelope-related transcriptional attenuator
MSDDTDRTSRSPSQRPDSGSRHRAERRSARLAARRRKRTARLSLVAGPALVVILVVVALFVFLGGPESSSGAETTTTSQAEAPIGGGASVLLVEQGEEVPAVVVLPSGDGGDLALAMPGNTLFKTDSGFKTPTELHASSQEEALSTVFAEDLGVDVGAIAWVQWADLRELLEEGGAIDSPPADLDTTAEDAGRVAEAVAVLLSGSENVGDAAIWDQLELAGDVDRFRANIELLSASIPEGGLTVAVLPGKVVEGAGFEYFEPDLNQARALLGGEGPGAEITVEVQNGSGVVSIAQQVGGMLEPLGFDLLPFRNADGFPDVQTTRIIVGPDAASAADQVRGLIGVGKLEQDDSLPPGRVIVIVGKDFVPPVSTGTSAAQ